jgi:putative hemolysin
VGITTIAILNGAIGETTLAGPLASWIAGLALLAPYSKGIALAIVVVAITYVSVVVGELVPKRLALLRPESIAAFVARPMLAVARREAPGLVQSASSGLILRLLRAAPAEEPPVTDEEIKVLMEQGAEAGVFHAAEQAIVSNVLRLDQQRVTSIMTLRKDIYFMIWTIRPKGTDARSPIVPIRGSWCARTVLNTCWASFIPATICGAG